MLNKQIIVPRVWRSELTHVIIFLVLCIVCVVLSNQYPATVIKGRLFSIGSYSMYLSLPLLWFFPFGSLLAAVFKIYNVKYILDSRGIEARVGILALHQKITRVRYEDIRSVDTEQTLLERFLDIGTVLIGTAATDTTEINLRGVAAPKELQEMIQNERDRRQKVLRKLPGDEQLRTDND